MVKKSKLPQIRSKIREKYGTKNDDFLVVTGGKINWARPETLNLMEAIISINNPKLKLIVFGKVSDDLNNHFDELCQSAQIKFIGWINAEESHYLMAASEIVVFPGLHSVMWEQACALGIPCIFRKLSDVNHVDLGGNAIFLSDVSSESLKTEIQDLFTNTEKYNHMKKIAENQGYNNFSYLEIAKKSIS